MIINSWSNKYYYDNISMVSDFFFFLPETILIFSLFFFVILTIKNFLIIINKQKFNNKLESKFSLFKQEFLSESILSSTILSKFLISNYYFYLIRLLSFLFLILLFFTSKRFYKICFSSWLICDSYSQYSKLCLILLFIIMLHFCYQVNITEEKSQIEFSFLLGFSFFFLLLSVSAFDFFSIYLIFEGLTFTLGPLIIINKISKNSLESGMKYILISCFASSLFLFSISLLYLRCQQIGFLDVQQFLNDEPKFQYWSFTSLIVLLPIISLLIKVGAFPFSTWLPDVYKNCSSEILFYFITVVKTSFIIILIRLLYVVMNDFFYLWQNLLLLSSAGSFIFGSLSTIGEKDLKKFITFASINQLGFILLGLANYNDIFSIINVLFFLFIYVINNILFFTVYLNFYNSKNSTSLDHFYNFKGLSKIYPFYSFCLSLALFSLIGLPPLSGFFSKFNILLNSINFEHFPIIVISLISSGISAYYYLILIKHILVDDLVENDLYTINIIKSNQPLLRFLIIILSVIFIFFFICHYELLFNFFLIPCDSLLLY